MENIESGERIHLEIPEELAGSRLDRALAALLPDRSRAFIRKLFDQGCVLIVGGMAKPALRVKAGQVVEVFVPEARELALEPQALPLDVLYEDGDLVVINKRPGMVAHPSQGHWDGTLVNALLHHYGESLSEIGGVLRPGIVHRLDRDTSGCLVAAKNDRAHAGLMRQFMEREVGKTYLAITDGVPRPPVGKVEGNMGRSSRDRRVQAMVGRGGRHSLTEYRTVENYGVLGLVECRLLTGRTHQARVHMAHVGAPVLCDGDYGRGGVVREGDLRFMLGLMETGGGDKGLLGAGGVVLGRQGLHAWRLVFRHPVEGREMEFEAELPHDMAAVLEPFRRSRANQR